MFLGFATQATGLQYTTVSRSAFLLYLNVLLVPIMGSIIFKMPTTRSTWLRASLVLMGMLLLGCDGGGPNVGDAWCLLAAFSSAMFILRLEAAARTFGAAELQYASMLTTAALCHLWLLSTDGRRGQPTRSELASAVYLGLVPTALCSFLQTVAQRDIEAAGAAIIFAMDPVYTALLGRLFLGERLGAKGLVGGGIILSASVLRL
jgi:drug/metabolite transporter (DMT)-like permease